MKRTFVDGVAPRPEAEIFVEAASNWIDGGVSRVKFACTLSGDVTLTGSVPGPDRTCRSRRHRSSHSRGPPCVKDITVAHAPAGKMWRAECINHWRHRSPRRR